MLNSLGTEVANLKLSSDDLTNHHLKNHSSLEIIMRVDKKIRGIEDVTLTLSFFVKKIDKFQ